MRIDDSTCFVVSCPDHDAPAFVAVYDTRIEISSPGGLPRGLTVEKALSGCSKIRNKAFAEKNL